MLIIVEAQVKIISGQKTVTVPTFDHHNLAGSLKTCALSSISIFLSYLLYYNHK